MTKRSDLSLEDAMRLARLWSREQMAADEGLLAATSPADTEGSRYLRERNAAKVALMREQLADNDFSQAGFVVAGIEREEGLSLSEAWAFAPKLAAPMLIMPGHAMAAASGTPI